MAETIWNGAVTAYHFIMDNLVIINVFFALIIVFFQRRSPQTVWTWLLLLYFIPILGFILYLVIGQDFHKSRMFKAKEIEGEIKYAVRRQEETIYRKQLRLANPEMERFRNLILYHTEDTDMANRKRMYTEEGKQYFSGNLYVPDDLETIDLEADECSHDGTQEEENGEDDAVMEEKDQQRLEAFEEMLKNIQKEYDSIQRQMEGLKNKGKTKSATYRQLMGRKMTYQSMLSMYEVYGLL